MPGSASATELLDQSDLNFVGNVEGKDLVEDLADVVVCDAVVGNVVIKFFEGLSTFIFDLVAEEFRRPPRGPLAYALMRPGVDRIRKIFDYERFGGSPLLGVKGTVIITHGRAKRRMIGFALGVGAASARARMPELIAETLPAARRGRARTSRPWPSRPPAMRPSTTPRSRPPAATGSMTGSAELSVARDVVDELIRLAAMEVPGVVRVDRAGTPMAVAVRRRRLGRLPDRRAAGRCPAVDRRSTGSSRSCRSPARSVRRSPAAIERLVDLEVGDVVVIVDGVGG